MTDISMMDIRAMETELWGGRVSDVCLMEHCGLLDKLLPGDVVLANRGFNIHNSVGLMCAEVKLPACGKKQLSKMDVDTSRQLAG